MASEKKVAIVTGSARGIGESTAVLLAEQGFNITVNYASSADEAKNTMAQCEAKGAEGLLIQGDIASDADCRRIVDDTIAQWGRLDVLINNAGTTTYVNHMELEKLTPEVWERTFSVNVFGTFQMVRAAEKPLRASGNGSVVNVGSIAGVAGIGSSIAYAASKGAMITMTLSLARVLGPFIRVNVVCPGFIEGEWLKEGLGDAVYKKAHEAARKGAPLGVTATADTVADSILHFIVGPQIVTGESMIVDGGRHLGMTPLTRR